MLTEVFLFQKTRRGERLTLTLYTISDTSTDCWKDAAENPLELLLKKTLFSVNSLHGRAGRPKKRLPQLQKTS